MRDFPGDRWDDDVEYWRLTYIIPVLALVGVVFIGIALLFIGVIALLGSIIMAFV